MTNTYVNTNTKSIMERDFWQKKSEKCDMASVNLEKTLQYLKIQGGLQSEYLTEY